MSSISIIGLVGLVGLGTQWPPIRQTMLASTVWPLRALNLPRDEIMTLGQLCPVTASPHPLHVYSALVSDSEIPC